MRLVGVVGANIPAQLAANIFVLLLMVRFFWVDIGFACFGIESTDGKVSAVAPVAGWMMGKTLGEIRPYLVSKRARVIEIPI